LNKTINIEDHLNTKFKDYAYYVVEQRAIPRLSDGLKNVQRRVMWIAKQNAKNFTKVNTLAGQCLPLHPHGDSAVAGAIGMMTQNFPNANNYPLLEGKGAFGNRLSGPGEGIGAPRYVSVKISDYAKKLLFIDEDLINMVPNYDGELEEPQNFLPIVPICLINGIRGIAVGYATNIPSYNLKDIIKIQKKIIQNKDISNESLLPYYGKEFKGSVYRDDNNIKTKGNYELEGKNLRITELPIGYNREQYIKVLDRLEEDSKISNYEDHSRQNFDFRIKLKRGKEYNDSKIISMFKLESSISENLTLINTNGKLQQYSSILEVIEEFTIWRFQYYKKRYLRLKEILDKKIEYNTELLSFIKFIIDNDYIKKMTKMSKSDICDDLKGTFKHLDRLLNIPIYSFSKEKMKEILNIIKKDKEQMKEYSIIINSDEKQREIYINELKELK